MNSVGKVIKLFISESKNQSRQGKLEIVVTPNGVEGDKFYNKDPMRAILLTSTHSYTMALEKQISMPYGTLGENILIDFNPYTLTLGKVIKIGEVLLEIAQNCTICNHLSVVDKSLPKLLKNDRGMFVKVVKSGIIKEGDKVYLVDKKSDPL